VIGLTGTATTSTLKAAASPGSSPARVDLVVPARDDVTVYMQILKADGVTPQSLAGYAPVMAVKRAPESSQAVVTLTASAGLAVTDSAAGKLTGVLAASLLAAAWSWWWQVYVTGGGERATAISGCLTLVAV
jgi:hypothetical protein